MNIRSEHFSVSSVLRPRLLVVDDDPGVIQVLARVLEPLGELFFGLNGHSAMDLAWRVKPELILLDAEMPGMDGFAVCAALKAAPELADIPVLFLTAHREVNKEIQALELGAVDFIHKPISPPIVQARVRTHLALKRKSDELQKLVCLDGLTGIANRRAFDQALALEWRRFTRTHAPMSLLMVDVDYFKRYNDCFGHLAGDDCLKAVAGVLHGMAKRAGDVAARYGGEEFVLLLPQTPLEQAEKIAQDLCDQVYGLARPHPCSDAAPVVTVSVGVACLAHQVGDGVAGADYLQELLSAADKALYRAKAAGRNSAQACLLSAPQPLE